MDLAGDIIQAQFRDGEVFVTLSGLGAGHPIGSPYVDLFWTPIVGPGAMAFARWAQHRLSPESVSRISAAEISEAIGRIHVGKACSIVKRAVQFHLADVVENDADFAPLGYVIQVRRAMPSLSDQRIEQLSPGLRQVHERMMEAVG